VNVVASRPGVPHRAARGRRIVFAPRFHGVESALQAPRSSSSSGHPLADDSVSAGLRRRAAEIDAAFAAIEPLLRRLSPRQFEDDFAARASAEIRAALGFDVPADHLTTTWSTPLDVKALYAHCVLATFCRLIERAFDRGLSASSDGENAEELIRRWGFHAIDITPCADGRLSGVVDYILRVPPAVVVSVKSHAGAMFDVEATLRQWEVVELERWRTSTPNAGTAPTRFLKIGVYHFSSVDPSHGGCAAHGSDANRAAGALLERLEQFEAAVKAIHGSEAATLLVGVDTDTDAIRVHVPDRAGRMAVARYIDNRDLFERTRNLPRETAKDEIRQVVADCAGVAADDAQTEGMRWLCGYLLKNNISQVAAVQAWHGGSYADGGHTERLIVVGDPVDAVQLRNLAFQAQMDTVEEAAGDLDIGIKILRELNVPRGLAIPILVHFQYDSRIPGARESVARRARRLKDAILARYASLAAQGVLHVHAVVRAGNESQLAAIESAEVFA
jgi:carboxysome shell carbonic anhydrase